MINETTILKALGFMAHSPNGESISGNDTDLSASCKNCGKTITSYYNEDTDRLSGWTAWRASNGSCKAVV